MNKNTKFREGGTVGLMGLPSKSPKSLFRVVFTFGRTDLKVTFEMLMIEGQ